MIFKKSQITLFIIFAIIILFITAIIVYYIVDPKNLPVEDPVTNVVNSFKTSILTCIEKSTIDGLFYVGKQGGVIYDYQIKNTATYFGPPFYSYGEFVLPLLEKKNDNFIFYNVSYGIIRSINEFETPFYPYGFEKLVQNPKTINSNYINIFGNYPIPGPFTPLCNPTGKNAIDQPGIVFFCTTYGSMYSKNSIQDYLETYITNKTIECMNSLVFYGINNIYLNENDVFSEVTFSNNEVLVRTYIPYTLEINENNIIKLGYFNIDVKNRLKLIHELAEKLIENDVNNIFFDIIKDSGKINDCRNWPETNSKCLKEGMSVSKIKNPCLKYNQVNCPIKGNYDNILVITDNKVLLNSESYNFYIAIQNRKPALDLIYDDSRLKEGFDIVGVVGERLIIDPKGYDPDEDYHDINGIMNARYSYNMWKEDYNELYFKWNCEFKDNDGNYVNIENCQNNPFNATYLIEYEKPKEFSNSIEFIETKRKAGYNLTKEDIGGHYLKVQVCDEENLCDYQILKILVCCSFNNGVCNFICD
jgi:hypothetical protein